MLVTVRKVGREIGPNTDYYTTALTTMVVLEEGEAVDTRFYLPAEEQNGN